MFVHGLGLKAMAYVSIIPQIEEIIWLGILAPCTYAFMLISGFYGIKFSKKKMLGLSITATIYYMATEMGNSILNFGGGIIDFIRHIPPISTKVWWFMAIYMIIMLLSPILNKGIDSISKKEYKTILISLLFIESYGFYLNGATSGSDLLGLLNIYLIGRYIYLHNIKPSKRNLILIWFFATSTQVLLLLLTSQTGYEKLTWRLLYYCNPLIIIQSISMFLLVISLPVRHCQTANFLGGHCLAIYLVTENIDCLFYPNWANLYCESHILSLLMIMVVCFCIIGLDYVVQKIVNRILTISYFKLG